MLHRSISLLLAISGSLAPLAAQGVPALVRDIDTQSEASLIQGDGPALLIGSTTFFAATSRNTGKELWKTDGTAGGTSLVLDIAPGGYNSSPDEFVSLGGILYFAATTVERGRELWRSDGTPGGTYRVRDIYSGEASSDPRQLTVVNNRVFFSAVHPTYGRELWHTDGTSNSTALAFDVRPGTTGSMSASSEIVWGVRVVSGIPFAMALFAADDGVHGAELWEASNSGGALRADIYAGANGSAPQGFVSQGGHVMFSAANSTAGREPYVTRESGATSAGDLNPGILPSSPADFAVGSFGGVVKFYFSALRTGYGRELWEYDTSTGNTTLIDDLYAGSTGSNPIPFVAGTTVLFSAETPLVGRELWKTDGTLRGTELVRDITGRGSSDPTGFLTLSTSPLRVLFAADNGFVGNELWITDATTAGTRIVRDIELSGSSAPRIRSRTSGGRALLTALTDSVDTFWYRTDGTNAGTSVLLPGVAGSGSSEPFGFRGSAPGASVWFAADDGSSGFEPWNSDGTAAGTQMLGNLHAGDLASIAAGADAVELDGRTIFRATTSGLGSELWITDGTPGGTQLLADIHPGVASSSPTGFTAMDGYVLFFATDPVHGSELWRTDGTPAGTTLVEDISAGVSSGITSGYLSSAVRDGVFYFAAATSSAGREPWISDGTALGTVRLKDIVSGSTSGIANLPHFVATTTHVFFVASDPTNGLELWRTTGTTAGTQLVADLSPGAASTSFYELLWHGGLLYFVAQTSSDRGLYSTTPSGSTAALVRSFPELFLGIPGLADLTSLGSKLLFAGYSSGAGWEPWTSDGTYGGTVILRDIRPGAESGLLARQVTFFFAYEGDFFAPSDAAVALFSAAAPESGHELWRTNGTNAGTVLHADIYPGPHGSFPKRLAFAGDRVWCSAYHPATGEEPYAMDPPAMTVSYLYGCPGRGGLVPALRASGTPFLGNGAFELLLEQARPSTVATVNVGFGPWNLPLGGGCDVLVDLLLPYVPFTVPTDPRGQARVALPLPGDPLLEGLDVFAQGLVVDPNGAFASTLSFTGGWRAILHSL